MLLAAAASADRGILPLLRAVLGPDELYSLVTIALLGSYANDLVRLSDESGVACRVAQLVSNIFSTSAGTLSVPCTPMSSTSGVYDA